MSELQKNTFLTKLGTRGSLFNFIVAYIPGQSCFSTSLETYKGQDYKCDLNMMLRNFKNTRTFKSNVELQRDGVGWSGVKSYSFQRQLQSRLTLGWLLCLG